MQNPSGIRMLTWAACAAVAASLGGCGSPTATPEPAATRKGVPTATETRTPVPTATIDPLAFHTVPPGACTAVRRESVFIGRPQGDMLAWMPGSDALAYVGFDEKHKFFLGDVWILRMNVDPPSYEKLASSAAGNLSWSPAGAWLVFTVLRVSEGVYSLQSIQADGANPLDLFPETAARTDGGSSPKIVMGWLSPREITARTSCGSECYLQLDIDVTDGTRRNALGQQVGHVDFWEVHDAGAAPGPVLEPVRAESAFFSPDGKRAAYLDEDGYLWMAVPADRSHYRLPDLGELTIFEVKWSDSGKFLAVHAGDKIYIYRFGCS